MNKGEQTEKPTGERVVLLEELRAQLTRLMSSDASRAEQIALQMTGLEPGDIQALNCLGKLHKDRGDRETATRYYQRAREIDPANQIANSQLERLGVATEHNALGRRASVHAEGGGSTTWTYDDAFPHVVAVLDRLYSLSQDWVPWAAVRDGLLEDANARRDLDDWAHRQRKTPFDVASVVMAHWTRSITVGINPYDATHERRDSDYALRPRPQ